MRAVELSQKKKVQVKYQGSKNSDGLPHGDGRLITATAEYRGQFAAGKFHGFGTLKRLAPEADSGGVAWIYTGHFWEGKRHGTGKIIFCRTDESYEGDWVHDTMQGRGKYRMESGTYDGDVANNKRHGIGRMLYTDDSGFYGLWENDTYHGTGRLVDQGATHDGRWIHGVMTGVFHMTKASGSVYKRHFLDGRLSSEEKIKSGPGFFERIGLFGNAEVPPTKSTTELLNGTPFAVHYKKMIEARNTPPSTANAEPVFVSRQPQTSRSGTMTPRKSSTRPVPARRPSSVQHDRTVVTPTFTVGRAPRARTEARRKSQACDELEQFRAEHGADSPPLSATTPDLELSRRPSLMSSTGPKQMELLDGTAGELSGTQPTSLDATSRTAHALMEKDHPEDDDPPPEASHGDDDDADDADFAELTLRRRASMIDAKAERALEASLMHRSFSRKASNLGSFGSPPTPVAGSASPSTAPQPARPLPRSPESANRSSVGFSPRSADEPESTPHPIDDQPPQLPPRPNSFANFAPPAALQPRRQTEVGPVGRARSGSRSPAAAPMRPRAGSMLLSPTLDPQTLTSPIEDARMSSFVAFNGAMEGDMLPGRDGINPQSAWSSGSHSKSPDAEPALPPAPAPPEDLLRRLGSFSQPPEDLAESFSAMKNRSVSFHDGGNSPSSPPPRSPGQRRPSFLSQRTSR